MTDVESSNESSRGVFRRRPDRPGWTVIGVSAFLVLAVSVPTLAVEEDWHGMSDDRSAIAPVDHRRFRGGSYILRRWGCRWVPPSLCRGHARHGRGGPHGGGAPGVCRVSETLAGSRGSANRGGVAVVLRGRGGPLAERSGIATRPSAHDWHALSAPTIGGALAPA